MESIVISYPTLQLEKKMLIWLDYVADYTTQFAESSNTPFFQDSGTLTNQDLMVQVTHWFLWIPIWSPLQQNQSRIALFDKTFLPLVQGEKNTSLWRPGLENSHETLGCVDFGWPKSEPDVCFQPENIEIGSFSPTQDASH